MFFSQEVTDAGPWSHHQNLLPPSWHSSFCPELPPVPEAAPLLRADPLPGAAPSARSCPLCPEMPPLPRVAPSVWRCPLCPELPPLPAVSLTLASPRPCQAASSHCHLPLTHPPCFPLSPVAVWSRRTFSISESTSPQTP